MQAFATMCSNVPNKGEQMVRYYGYDRNVSRGKRKKAGADDRIPEDLKVPVNTRKGSASV